MILRLLLNPYILIASAALLFASGWIACTKFHKASELAAVKAAMHKQDKVAMDYETRRANRERIVYVEKPHHADCAVDADWVRQFNKHISTR